MKKIKLFICLGILILSGFTTVASSIGKIDSNLKNTSIVDDFDPLVDISITVDILAIRALEDIDARSEADFFLILKINDEEFVSPVWNNTNYLYNCWTVTKNVPDEIDIVNITFELWDWNSDKNKICDISKENNKDSTGFDINVKYDLKTGRWYGDDYAIGDSSGYGRVCGTGDGSIYKNEADCEIWFNINQNDFDNDSIPYWVETYVYGTDPMVNNSGEDDDSDNIPIEWEHRWGFNPNIWDDHENFDPDGDSITNYEEFLTSDFNSDPFRKDVFLELDFMADSPNGKSSIVPMSSVEMLKNPFHRRNIVFHVDCGVVNGGEIFPFDDNIKIDEVLEIYHNFFLHNDENNWRRGVFHYGVFVYSCRPAGYGFSGDTAPYWGYIPGTNCFVVSSRVMKRVSIFAFKPLEYVYASVIVHEMGHNFGIRWGEPFGCDNQFGKYPWQIGYWLFRNYKSIMNYRYTYKILDYSDGSHGHRDYDDWANIDLTYFEKPLI